MKPNGMAASRSDDIADQVGTRLGGQIERRHHGVVERRMVGSVLIAGREIAHTGDRHDARRIGAAIAGFRGTDTNPA